MIEFQLEGDWNLLPRCSFRRRISRSARFYDGCKAKSELIVAIIFKAHSYGIKEYYYWSQENEEPTRTLLSFFITSVCGSYEDLICFVPCVTLSWEKLLTNFMQVGRVLHSIGFQVLPILTDGHKTNVRFFKELSGGHTGSPIVNPFDASLPMFPLFDPVHLMKNLYSNFQRRR